MKKKKRIKFHYNILVDGVEQESTFGKEPAVYVEGEGGFFPKMIYEITGMAVGDRKRICLFPRDAYGPRDNSKVREVPTMPLPDGKEPTENAKIELVERKTGKTLHAMITEVKEQTMILDFNHPLAGQDLECYIEVVEILK